MQKVMPTTSYNLNESQRKGLLVISPILIGALAYGVSVAYMVVTNLFQIFF